MVVLPSMCGRGEKGKLARPRPLYSTRYAEYLTRYSIATHQVTTIAYNAVNQVLSKILPGTIRSPSITMISSAT